MVENGMTAAPRVSEIVVQRDGRGYPAVAAARCLVAAPAAAVWPILADVRGYAGLVPMLHQVRVDGAVATVQLRVGFGLFGSTFSFVARIQETRGQSVELAYVSGEPAGLRLRLALGPGHDESTTQVHVELAFDPDSLGWLASLFSKRHPELRYGIVPGCALALVESIRLRAEARI